MDVCSIFMCTGSWCVLISHVWYLFLFLRRLLHCQSSDMKHGNCLSQLLSLGCCPEPMTSGCGNINISAVLPQKEQWCDPATDSKAPLWDWVKIMRWGYQTWCCTFAWLFSLCLTPLSLLAYPIKRSLPNTTFKSDSVEYNLGQYPIPTSFSFSWFY